MKSVHSFYNSQGWKIFSNHYEDANINEDLRLNSREYVSKCRKRILRYIPNKGSNILDFASGPIQYKEYLQYSRKFNYRHCVDFSKDAIKIAKSKIGKKGKFYCKDFLDINFNVIKKIEISGEKRIFEDNLLEDKNLIISSSINKIQLFELP